MTTSDQDRALEALLATCAVLVVEPLPSGAVLAYLVAPHNRLAAEHLPPTTVAFDDRVVTPDGEVI